MLGALEVAKNPVSSVPVFLVRFGAKLSELVGSEGQVWTSPDSQVDQGTDEFLISFYILCRAVVTVFSWYVRSQQSIGYHRRLDRVAVLHVEVDE